jgi:hypothetical protein
MTRHSKKAGLGYTLESGNPEPKGLSACPGPRFRGGDDRLIGRATMNRFSFGRFVAVLHKEWIQVRRDPMTLRLIIALPIMQLFLF